MLLRDPLKSMFLEHARVQTGSSWAKIEAVISSVLIFHTLIVESDEPLNSTSLFLDGQETIRSKNKDSANHPNPLHWSASTIPEWPVNVRGPV